MLYFQGFEDAVVITMRVRAAAVRPPCKKVSFVLYFQRPSKKGATNDMGKYTTNSAAGAQTIETLGGDYALKWDDETQMGVRYPFKTKRSKSVRRAFLGLLAEPGAWHDSSEGWQCAEREVRLDSWNRARRMVFARRPAEKMPKRKKNPPQRKFTQLDIPGLCAARIGIAFLASDEVARMCFLHRE